MNDAQCLDRVAVDNVNEGALVIDVFDHFVNQVRFWGIKPSFAFVEEPQTNGVAERFNRMARRFMLEVEGVNPDSVES